MPCRLDESGNEVFWQGGIAGEITAGSHPVWIFQGYLRHAPQFALREIWILLGMRKGPRLSGPRDHLGGARQDKGRFRLLGRHSIPTYFKSDPFVFVGSECE